LIVNEAMCAGLPVVVSDEVGCVPDLVKDAVNCYHMKAGDVRSLAAALEKLLVNQNQRQNMGTASLSIIIRGWGYEQCRQGITAALRQCLQMR
jgi:glycosyltransferase involved in cell wall biosynthesis